MTKAIETEPTISADILLDAFKGVTKPLAETAPHGRRASAVLIPLVEDRGELKVILTQTVFAIASSRRANQFPWRGD